MAWPQPLSPLCANGLQEFRIQFPHLFPPATLGEACYWPILQIRKRKFKVVKWAQPR